MKRVKLFEHQRLYRASSKAGENDAQIELPLYERLRHFDFYHRENNQRIREREQKDRVFDWGYGYAKARQWVGVVQVPGLQVEILPKAGAKKNEAPDVAASNLLYMLSVAGMIPLRERDFANVSLTRSGLMETLAAIFAKKLAAQLSRGIDRSYQAVEENIRTFKGKLLVTQHVRANAAHRERMYCRFDEFSADTTINRIFKACCNVLRRAVKSNSTQKALRVSLDLLDDVRDTVPGDHLFDSIVLNRQNERFADLLQFSRLILAQNAPTGQGGKTRTFSLLFDMNVVFERFIGAAIKRWVVPEMADRGAVVRTHLQAQGKHRYLLKNTQSGTDAMRLEPDVLVTNGSDAKALLILDTKWKRPERSKPSQSDLYQLYAYANGYQCPRNILLYPKTFDTKPHCYVLHENGVNSPASGEKSPKRIESRFINLDYDLRRNHNRLISDLAEIVNLSLGYHTLVSS